jgi:hypothetical protein
MLAIHRGGAWLIVRGVERYAQSMAAQIIANMERSTAGSSGAKWRVQESRSFGRVQIVLLTGTGPNQP